MPIKHVDIIYNKYLDKDMMPLIGGVQTYISDLCGLLEDMKIKVRVIQFADNDFAHELTEYVSVYGFRVKNTIMRGQYLYDRAVKTRAADTNTLTIFATEGLIPRKTHGECIAIQHGIYWDIPHDKPRNWLRQVLSRILLDEKLKWKMQSIRKMICVDYNFLNWYRTRVDNFAIEFQVIPNYSKVAPVYQKPENQINIIFARRLFEYRGTRVFAAAIKRVLSENTQVYVTIAGSGPDESWLRNELESSNRIRFIKYSSDQSLAIHENFHIAVVPTVGSEGTSLSLLEAMSAQCAVICSDVGGLTNIVLDGFNGLMVNAGNAQQLYEGIAALVNDGDLRNTLATNAYNTVKTCFSYEKWAEKWTEVIKEYL